MEEVKIKIDVREIENPPERIKRFPKDLIKQKRETLPK